MQKIATIFNAPGWAGLFSNVFLVWTVLALSIFMLAKLGSGFGAATAEGPRSAPWTPSGAFIGGVWSLLYTLMALSLWSLNRMSSSPEVHLKWVVVLLIVFCLIWPFYAFDAMSRWPGLLGNLGILLIAAYAFWRILPYSLSTALLILPVVVWIIIANLSILDGARRYGW